MPIGQIILLLLKYAPQIIALAPEIAKLFEALENANREGDVQVKLKESIQKMHEAINANDAEKFNAAFNSRKLGVRDGSKPEAL